LQVSFSLSRMVSGSFYMKSSHNLTPSDGSKIWCGQTFQRGELPFQFLDLCVKYFGFWSINIWSCKKNVIWWQCIMFIMCYNCDPNWGGKLKLVSFLWDLNNLPSDVLCIIVKEKRSPHLSFDPEFPKLQSFNLSFLI
jgi:hypothetical protein